MTRELENWSPKRAILCVTQLAAEMRSQKTSIHGKGKANDTAKVNIYLKIINLLATTALLDDAFNTVPPTITTGGALDDVASDLPGSTGDTSSRSSSFGGFSHAI